MEAVFIDMVSFFLQHGKVETEYLIDILIAKDTGKVTCPDADDETVLQFGEQSLIELPTA
jgi:hypothetical protein